MEHRKVCFYCRVATDCDEASRAEQEKKFAVRNAIISLLADVRGDAFLSNLLTENLAFLMRGMPVSLK